MRTLFLFLIMMAMMYSAIAKNENVMKHITLEQFVQGHISEHDLVSLCDSNSLEDIKGNMSLLEEVNVQAVDEVYSYLRGIYAIPIEETQEKPIDPALRNIIGDMMVYKLYKRRDPSKMEYIQGNYKVCLDKLKDIRNGKMLIDIAKPETDNTQTGNILYQTSEQRYGDKFTKLL